jgi:hypothetical protein
VVVPEAATLLFAGGFPRYSDPDARRAAQVAIYHVQRQIEDVQQAAYRDRILLCDRGTVDGAAYWPGDPDEFFAAVASTAAGELLRYDGVLFFETAAAGGLRIEGGNPARTETLDEAIALDRRLQALWQRHPRFRLVPHQASFLEKIRVGLAALEGLIAEVGAAG